jgi:hypothetical protein
LHGIDDVSKHAQNAHESWVTGYSETELQCVETLSFRLNPVATNSPVEPGT